MRVGARNILSLTSLISTTYYVHSWHCMQWVSSLDGKYRSHCYLYQQGTFTTTLEAEATCKEKGGQLAPYVDDVQFRFWQDFLPDNNRGEIILGVTDMVQEGVWTAFDGAPVVNLPWNREQPNGGRIQNCVVINAEPPGYKLGEEFKLQDKDCSQAFDGFLCYRDEMCRLHSDGNISNECYWFISNKLNWDFYGANAQCRKQDGVLASVTSFNQLNFLKAAFNIFSSIRSHSDVVLAWLGVYAVGNQIRNVNSDNLPTGLIESNSATSDLCLVLLKMQNGTSNATLYPCSTSNVTLGICTKTKLGFRWFTERNFTSDTYFRNILQIDKSQTTAEIMKSSSVYDDRVSSRSLGFVGVSVIVIVWLFVVFLDLGVRNKNYKKSRKRKRKKRTQTKQRHTT